MILKYDQYLQLLTVLEDDIPTILRMMQTNFPGNYIIQVNKDPATYKVYANIEFDTEYDETIFMLRYSSEPEN